MKSSIVPNVDELFSPPAYPLITDTTAYDGDAEDEELTFPVASPKRSKIAAYAQLVSIAAECAATLYAAPTVAIAQAISFAVAQSEATHAGLTEQEIQTAMRIGEFRGKAEKPVPIQPKLAVVNTAVPIGEYGVLWVHGRTAQPMEMAKV